MTEKRMLVIDADLLGKIDASRGELSRPEFLNLLYESHLDPGAVRGDAGADHVSRHEFTEFSRGIRELMRNFLEFALSYGLELGRQPEGDGSFDEVMQRIRSLGDQVA